MEDGKIILIVISVYIVVIALVLIGLRSEEKKFQKGVEDNEDKEDDDLNN